ncbi:MAG: DNA integrity scanning protein DisA nucleotide-binding domain protein [Elusimicrobiota bacterium]
MADLGKNPLLAKVLFSEHVRFLDEIVLAVEDFSVKKIGALIVLEQETGLKNIAETGTPIFGEVSQELLSSIFQTSSPLHDGAVLVSPDGRLVAAKCLLPLTPDSSLAKSYGVRHRAAVSLAEASDAIVLVVSEQTGRVSMARNGRLDPEINIKAVARELKDLYQTKARKSLLRHPRPDSFAGERRSA